MQQSVQLQTTTSLRAGHIVFTVCRQCQWEALCMSYWAQLILNKAQSLILAAHEVLMGDPFVHRQHNKTVHNLPFFAYQDRCTFLCRQAQRSNSNALGEPSTHHSWQWQLTTATYLANSFQSDNSKNEPTFTESIASSLAKKLDKMNVATCLPKLISCEMLPSLPLPTPPQKLNITPVTLVRKDQDGLTGQAVVPCYCWRN